MRNKSGVGFLWSQSKYSQLLKKITKNRRKYERCNAKEIKWQNWRDMLEAKENKNDAQQHSKNQALRRRSFKVPTYIVKPSNKWRESQNH